MRQTVLSALLIFILAPYIRAQKIEIGKRIDYNLSLLDEHKNALFVYGPSNYKKIDLNTFEIDSLPIHISDDFKFENFTGLVVDSTHYFIHKHGGLVYRNRNDSIIRMDKSFNHLMQVYSSIFEYDSKIHRFGGYGFWSARNFITYFNESLKEWEIVNAENSTVFPEESFRALHVLINDELYIFNSHYNDPKNRYELAFNEKMWKYNFLKKEWSYLGDTEFINYESGAPIIKFNNKLLIHLSHKLVVIDVLNNTIKEYETGIAARRFSPDYDSFYLNNRFYYLNTQGLGIFYLSVATESEVFGKELSSKALYTSYKNLKLALISFAMLGVLILLIWLVKKLRMQRKSIQLLDNGLLYRQKFIQLGEESIQILDLLLTNEEVNSSEILKITEQDQFSRAHNERLKFQKIEKLNFQLKTLLAIEEDLITSSKSKYDRRIRVYSINKIVNFYRY